MVTPISPERAFKDQTQIAAAYINPAGTAIAYVRTSTSKDGTKPEAQIWLCDLNGENRRQLTQVGTGNGDPAWSPDSKSIAFVTSREGEDKPHSVAILSMDGGEAKLISTHLQRPSNPAWSPDGKSIAYVVPVDPDNKDEIPVDPKADPKVRVTRRPDYKQDGLGYLGEVRTQIFTVDVESGERKQITEAASGHFKPTWSPDGKSLVAHVPNEGIIRSKFELISIETGEIEIFGPEHGASGLASWSPDSSKIFLSIDDPAIFHPDYYIFDVASRKLTKVGEGVDFTAHGFFIFDGPPVWLNEQEVLVVGSSKGKGGLWTIDLVGGSNEQFGLWESGTHGASVDRNLNVLVQVASSINGFQGISVVDLKSGEQKLLWNEIESFVAETPLAQYERIEIEREGFTVEGWLFKPADFDPKKKYPIVLDVHGGPQGAYGYALSPWPQIAATNGYLVLQSNPRGSTDYGKQFVTAALKDWGNEDYKDLMAILDKACELPYVDETRQGVYGYSYGGYMTSWILGHTTRFGAAVCGAPVYNLISMYGSSDISYYFLVHQIGGTPWTNFDDFVRMSPSTYIHNATTPTLVVCGESDDRCPIGQSEELFMSLLQLGVETEFARYPGGAHGFIANGPISHRIDFMERWLSWMDDHIGASKQAN